MHSHSRVIESRSSLAVLELVTYYYILTAFFQSVGLLMDGVLKWRT